LGFPGFVPRVNSTNEKLKILTLKLHSPKVLEENIHDNKIIIIIIIIIITVITIIKELSPS
jgi:hypothetical protein